MKRIFTCWPVALMALAGFLPGFALGAVPGIITYQGRVTSNGTNFTGTGQFKFTLVQPGLGTTTTTLWSQDGKATPISVVSVPVTNGLFTVALGDTTIPGMENPIPPEVFDNSVVRLRVWFNDGASGFAQLAPDQRLTSVGYAMRAANVVDGAITGAQIAPGAITNTHIANNAIGSSQIANVITLQTLNLGSINWDGTLNVYAKPGGGGIGMPSGDLRARLSGLHTNGMLELFGDTGFPAFRAFATSDGGALRIEDDASLPSVTMGALQAGGYLSVWRPGGNLGVNITGGNPIDVGGEIGIYHSDAGGFSRLGIMLDGNSTAAGGEISVRDLNGVETVEILGSTASGQGSLLTLKNGLGDTTLTLDGDASGRGSAAAFYNGTNAQSVVIDGNNGGAGLIDVKNIAGATRVRLDGSSTNTSGEISVFDDTGTETIELIGNSSATTGGQLIMRGNGGSTTVRLEAENGANQGAELTLFNGSGDPTVILDADNLDNSGSLTLGNGAGHYGVFLDGGYTGFGRIQARNSSGSTRVQIDGEGDGTGGEIVVQDASGTATVKLSGAQTSTSGGRIELSQANGTNTVILDGEVGNGGGGYLQLRNGGGVGTITLDSDFSGEGRITTQVLQITGGSDLSEQFDVRSAHAAPEPGMIVCIDPKNPGELAVSSRAYDRTVAGVMSGAGGVKPGMLMGQAGSKADGKHPVALTGRVYCLVDASHGAIEPGDLITSSDTPGHGMKVTNFAQAQGAIIGKAMTGLARGRGLVLMLVSLQ